MPADDDPDVSTRRVRIAAVIGGVILTVGLAVAIGTASGNDPAPASTPSPAGGATRSSPPALPLPSPSTSAPSAASATPVVRWHGRLTVSGASADRDLDSVPARTAESDRDLTGDFVSTALDAASGAQLALLHGGRPGFERCRDAVSTGGVDELERIDEGDLVCVITSQGRVALLRTTFASQTTASPILRFDVTVWDPPLGGRR